MIDFASATERDQPFAWALYRDSIEPLAVAIGSWSEQQERSTVEQSFADGQAQLIMRQGERVGWIHVRITPSAVELWQLFVAPSLRGEGIGGEALRLLQARASALGLPILLSVLRNNPAKRLYVRAGFSVHAESPHHLFLWWSPKVAVT